MLPSKLHQTLAFVSYGNLLGIDIYDLVPNLLTQLLQVIAVGRRGDTGQYEID